MEQPLFRYVGGHPPYDIADIISDKQRASSIDCHADREAQHITVRVDKTGEYISMCPGRVSVGELHKNHFVATPRLTVPGAVQADECPARKTLLQ